MEWSGARGSEPRELRGPATGRRGEGGSRRGGGWASGRRRPLLSSPSGPFLSFLQARLSVHLLLASAVCCPGHLGVLEWGPLSGVSAFPFLEVNSPNTQSRCKQYFFYKVLLLLCTILHKRQPWEQQDVLFNARGLSAPSPGRGRLGDKGRPTCRAAVRLLVGGHISRGQVPALMWARADLSWCQRVCFYHHNETIMSPRPSVVCAQCLNPVRPVSGSPWAVETG